MAYICSYCSKGVVESLPAYCPSCNRPLTVLKPIIPVTEYQHCTWCKFNGTFTVPGNCPNCSKYLKGFIVNH